MPYKTSNFRKIWCTLRQKRELQTLDFIKPNTISLHDYQLILCMLEFLNKSQDEIRKLIPKDPSVSK